MENKIKIKEMYFVNDDTMGLIPYFVTEEGGIIKGTFYKNGVGWDIQFDFVN